MGKHTPGPWIPRKDPHGGDKDWCVGIDDPSVAVDYVAVCWDRDAHLIAAAPDLLEALEMARAEFAGLPHSLGYDFTHLPKIDAAIAKAKGEA